MNNMDFASRLATACNQKPEIPPPGKGRQAWIKTRLRVSHEAVSKWFSGESRPRPSTMKALASLLAVDEAWLSLGVAPDQTPQSKKTRSAQVSGAANVFMGLLQVQDGRVAFPTEDDPAAGYVDFYAILHGTHMAFHVALATVEPGGVLRFAVPNEYRRCRVIGAVPLIGMHLDFIHLPRELIEEHGESRGGYYEVRIDRSDAHYRGGDYGGLQVEDFDFA